MTVASATHPSRFTTFSKHKFIGEQLLFTNKEKSGASFLRRPVAIAALVGLAATLAIGVGVSSASAATGNLTNYSQAMSNNQAGATGVTYTLQLTTATTAVISKLVFPGAPSQSGAIGLGMVYGVGSGVASMVNGTGLVYTLNTPVSIAAGTPIYIEFTGVVNGNPAGNYISSAQTFDNASTPVLVDQSGISAETYGSNNTAATIQVAKSLSFTNDTPAYTLLMDPSLPSLADETKLITLGVKTNAGQGYTVTMKDTGLKNGGSGAGAYTIPASATGVSTANFAANTFGVSGNGLSSSNGLAVAGATINNVVSGISTTGAVILSNTKPTGNTADVLGLLNRVKIDYSTPAGTYTDTITYTATPAY
jgi:hypothetical protein